MCIYMYILMSCEVYEQLYCQHKAMPKVSQTCGKEWRMQSGCVCLWSSILLVLWLCYRDKACGRYMEWAYKYYQELSRSTPYSEEKIGGIRDQWATLVHAFID